MNEFMRTNCIALNLLKINRLLLLIGVIFIFSCNLNNQTKNQPDLIDLTEEIDSLVKVLQLPLEEFQLLAWLEPDLLLMVNLENRNSNQGDSGILTYNLSSSELKEIPYQVPENCSRVLISHGSRLPNGNLAVIIMCINVKGISSSLFAWEQGGDNLQELFEFPVGFSATDYTFYPDMINWIQEAGGDGISNKIYHFTMGGEQEQLFSEYERVGAPALSPDGRELVLAINQDDSQQSTNLFSGVGGLRSEMFSPWNIYLQNQENRKLMLILSDVKVPEMIKWSPTGDWIAMGATYNDMEGVWLFDKSGSLLIRIWPEMNSFEWSPDGTQLLIRTRDETEADAQILNTAVLVNLSFLHRNN